MELKKLVDELKELLQVGEVFKDIFDKFLNITEVRSLNFIEDSEIRSNHLLSQIIIRVLENQYGELFHFDAATMYYPDFSLWHGALSVNSGQGSFFYFDDLKMGLVVANPGENQGTALLRFTGDEVPMGTFVTYKESNTTH